MNDVVIEMLGQAAVSIRAGAMDVVSDPWVLRKAQLGSWSPYPPRDAAEIRQQIERIDRATHIYVSHDHADHFDPELLRALAPKKLVVGHFNNETFRRALHATAHEAGHSIVELASGETLTLAEGVVARIIPEQPRFRTNSMFLLATPVGAILNANDCGLNSAQLQGIVRRHKVRVFLYTLNFMANGYPFPYLHPDDPKLLGAIEAVRQQVVGSFRTAMQVLNPDLSIAFAGPVTFADKVNAHLNVHPEALDWSRMVDQLSGEGRVAWPVPGTLIRLGRDNLSLEEPCNWRDIIATRPPSPPISSSTPEPLDRELLEKALARFVSRVGGAIARSGQRIGLPLYLASVPCLDEIDSDAWSACALVDLDACSFKWVDRAEEPHLTIVSTPSVLSGFLEGTITFDELLLSAYARFSRQPDVFHSVLHNFLRFGHDAEATEAVLTWYAQRASSKALIERRVDGVMRQLPKFCPHEGESLELAPIRDGRVVCPRHKWCFELDTGACVAEGDPTVNLYQHTRGSA